MKTFLHIFTGNNLFPFSIHVAILLSFISCGTKEPPLNVDVNAAFAIAPPTAKEITIRIIENNKAGNLLVVVDFGKEGVKGPYHTIMLDTVKLTLRDDGKGDDESAGDGKYSIILNEDIPALIRDLEMLQNKRQEIMDSVKFDFVGRHLTTADHRELRSLDVKTFLSGKPLVLPRKVYCLLFNASVPHSILVTQPRVLENDSLTINPCSGAGTAGGAWTFEKLFTDIVNEPLTGVATEDIVKSWLETWLNDVTVNSDIVRGRDAFFTLVIKPWVNRSGSPPGSFTIDDWQLRPLNLSKAPFKLIAIVNRLDLRGNIGYGISNAGEGRFVFEVLDSVCRPLGGVARPFTIIFEYGIPIKSCSQLLGYAREWYDLKNHVLGSDGYIDALKKITDVFATANADPSRPNGSSLNQVRTNEVVLASPWELREFAIDPESPKLLLTTVKQEPAQIFNGATGAGGIPAEVDKLKDWINANAALILENKHVAPATLPSGQPFLGGKAHSEPGFWTATGILDTKARHHFSLNTCGGCHTRETNTSFVHLSGANFGSASTPSGFLTGITLSDPVSGDALSFSDLSIRKSDLEDLLCIECKHGLKMLLHVLSFDPIRMEH